jgi:hypothetical protein
MSLAILLRYQPTKPTSTCRPRKRGQSSKRYVPRDACSGQDAKPSPFKGDLIAGKHVPIPRAWKELPLVCMRNKRVLPEQANLELDRRVYFLSSYISRVDLFRPRPSCYLIGWTYIWDILIGSSKRALGMPSLRLTVGCRIAQSPDCILARWRFFEVSKSSH